MKKLLLLVAVFTAYTCFAFAQLEKVKAYQMITTLPLKPKRGQEQKFEEGVKAHNAKYHASGPNAARLSMITEGSGSDGWYVWAMGPHMYTDMDHQPQGDKAHDDDWTTTVDVHVEEYGESTFWKLQEELSVTPANYNPDRIDVWTMDIKPGMREQFSGLIKKWKALWEAQKYPFAMRVFFNDLWSADGKDVSIVYSFAKYSEFDLELNLKKNYEALHGSGSYDNFWKTWNECVNSTDEHIRKFIK